MISTKHMEKAKAWNIVRLQEVERWLSGINLESEAPWFIGVVVHHLMDGYMPEVDWAWAIARMPLAHNYSSYSDAQYHLNSVDHGCSLPLMSDDEKHVMLDTCIAVVVEAIDDSQELFSWEGNDNFAVDYIPAEDFYAITTFDGAGKYQVVQRLN